MKCSRCPAEAREGQRLCLDCHAASMRAVRATQKERLLRIESLLEQLLSEGRKGPHKATRYTEEVRMHA